MPRLFLSYSHDSEAHRARVLTLARNLLAVGHHVTLDRFTAHPDPNWPQWMARELIAADVVLCICTATYRERFEGTATGGFGVAWEGHLISTELYRMKGRPGRFVPVEVDEDAVPLTLRGLPVVPFEDVVAHLGGVVGPPGDEPEVHPGWTEAMSVGALVGPIWKPLRPPRADEGYAPTQLLRAEHAGVPYLGRAQQVQDLEEWCRGGGVRVRVVHGPGGAGKTRLSLEIAANRCRGVLGATIPSWSALGGARFAVALGSVRSRRRIEASFARGAGRGRICRRLRGVRVSDGVVDLAPHSSKVAHADASDQ